MEHTKPSHHILAFFKGKDGSEGYKHGQQYVLELRGSSICRLDGTGHCVYNSITAFLNNWSVASTITNR